jgi:protein SCO1/2
MIGNNAFPTVGRTIAVALALVVCAASMPFARAGQKGGGEPRKGATHYSCPMHRSVTSETPGTCPECGMALRQASGAPEADATNDPPSQSTMRIPDVELLDQDGRKVRFYTDLVKGRVVAINFIFTTCTTICPLLGATFARVRKETGERGLRDVQFISISVDPVTDTPERLKAWGARFHAGPGWTFVTGEKQHVDQLLRALSASTPRRDDHSPTVLVVNDARGQWTRSYGLAKPSQIVRDITNAAEGRLESAGHGAHARPAQEPSAAQKYFTDVELLNQDGQPVRFYSDVLKGKTIVVNVFFTTCASVCPPMSRKMEKVQDALGDRVGRDVFLVSITVDPLTDTPERLKDYAKTFHARPGWIFLTGKKENVDWALYKLGQYVEQRDDHKTIWIIGNETTGLWKKALGLAKTEELVRLVEEAANDKAIPTN